MSVSQGVRLPLVTSLSAFARITPGVGTLRSGLPVLDGKYPTTEMVDSHGVSVTFKSAKHVGLFVFIFLASKARPESAGSFRRQSAGGQGSELEARGHKVA